jgi:hypothetical protein
MHEGGQLQSTDFEQPLSLVFGLALLRLDLFSFYLLAMSHNPFQNRRIRPKCENDFTIILTALWERALQVGFFLLAGCFALGAGYIVGRLACSLMLPGVDVNEEFARAPWWRILLSSAGVLVAMGFGVGPLYFARLFWRMARDDS